MVSSDKAYDFILAKILSGEYPPGKPLISDSLSVAIGVSRTPVRDALRQLEKAGLVSIYPHEGACVKVMDAKEYMDTCGMRLALEVFAAGLAAVNRTDDDLRTIKHALERMRLFTQRLLEAVGPDATKIEPLVDEDVRFHMGVIAASKNGVIKREILKIQIVSRVVAFDTPSAQPATKMIPDQNTRAHRLNVLKEHEEIFNAIEKRDVLGAKLAKERHIQEIIDDTYKTFTQIDSVTEVGPLTDEEKMYSGKR